MPGELDGTVEPATRIWLTDPERPHVMICSRVTGRATRCPTCTDTPPFDHGDAVGAVIVWP